MAVRPKRAARAADFIKVIGWPPFEVSIGIAATAMRRCSGIKMGRVLPSHKARSRAKKRIKRI
ncbi:hypothetical protein NBRC116596_27420 [Litorivita sp. NS0012-18]